MSVRKLLSAGFIFLVVLAFASLAFGQASQEPANAGNDEMEIEEYEMEVETDAGTDAGTDAATVPDAAVDTRPQRGMTPPPAVPPSGTDSSGAPGTMPMVIPAEPSTAAPKPESAAPSSVSPAAPSATVPGAVQPVPGDQGTVPRGPAVDSSAAPVTVPPGAEITVPGPVLIVPAPDAGSAVAPPAMQQSAPSDMGTFAPSARDNMLTRPATPGTIGDTRPAPDLREPAMPDTRPQQGTTPPPPVGPLPGTSTTTKEGAPGTMPMTIPADSGTVPSALPPGEDLRPREGTTPPPESDPAKLRPQSAPAAPSSGDTGLVPSPARPEASQPLPSPQQAAPSASGQEPDIIIITPVPQGSSPAVR